MISARFDVLSLFMVRMLERSSIGVKYQGIGESAVVNALTERLYAR